MKFAAVSIVYNEEKLIKGCIESLRPFVEEHLVMVSERPYYGDPEPLDKSAEIAEELGATVIKGVWELDHSQRNSGIMLLQDYDWIIVTDVDMWFEHESVKNLIDVLSVTTEDEAYVIKQISYWKDIEHVLADDDFMPVIALRPKLRFKHIGCLDVRCRVIDSFYIHHINWCKPKNILKKVLTYPHAPEFDGKKWYEEKYMTWEEGQMAILPDKVLRVEKRPLPAELRKYL